MKKIISNEIVTLRSLEPTDLDVLFKWENDCWLWTVSNIMTPSPKSYLWQYLQNYDSDIFNTRQLRLWTIDEIYRYNCSLSASGIVISRRRVLMTI